MKLFYPQRDVATEPLFWLQTTAILAIGANLFSTSLANVGFVAFLILFVFTCVSKRRKFLSFETFPWAVALSIAAYIGWQVVGLTYTDAPMTYALKNVFTERKIVYILPLALVFVEEKPKLRFLYLFLLTSSVALAISFVLYLLTFIHPTPFNPSAVLRSHATQGMVFAMAAFLATWFANRQVDSFKKYQLYALALGFCLNIAVVTPGRSGYVVFLVLLIWYFFSRGNIRSVVLGGVVTSSIAAAAFFLSPSIHDRMMTGITEAKNYSTDTNETSLGRRMVMFHTTLEIIRQDPVLGIGTGGYKQRFSAIAAEKYTGWRAQPFDDPHNQYLFVWAENGLIGLMIFLAMLFVIGRQCVKGGAYGRMAAGCLFAWCATSLFSGHFRTFPEGHLIAFVIGILMITRSSPVDLTANSQSHDGA